MAPKKKVEDVEAPVKEAKAEKKQPAPKKAAKAPAKKAEPKAKAPAKHEKPKKKAEPKAEEKPVEKKEEPVAEEEKPKKTFTMTKPRPLPRPVEKSTLDLDEETRRLLGARKTNKASLPEFNRIDSHKNKSLKLSWRKPKGHHSQLRRQRKAKGSLVKVGFGSPAAVRGLHSSGYEEVLVHRPQDIQGITKTQAIRVAGGVGRKKQAEIEKAAKELNIKVLNPLNTFEEV
ncbi:MAG TPA: 50S ribosomal protein L32e [Methanocella sp.]|uniref:50S ribosomal protein L32e n=1 Tax=Methanocella sp. TaxID=2052833 RepID=UPI002CB912FD|nr:50S ribosomal protein L32e [Methanocella sp.]HTY91125.1 50S ribosomal protein L32e [Methanocella sp.]